MPRINHASSVPFDAGKCFAFFLRGRPARFPFLLPSPARRQHTLPITLERLLSSKVKSREERNLIWRAWEGLSEDAQAARLTLLDSLLETLQTDDYRDARRLRSLLDSKHHQIDSQQRSFYSFWAHSLLHETDIAFRHFERIPRSSQLYYKDIFMHRIVHCGDWTTGVKLWNLFFQLTGTAWPSDGRPSTIESLLKLVPNVHTKQFLAVVPAGDRAAFEKVVDGPLINFLAYNNDSHALTLFEQFSAKGNTLDVDVVAAIMRLMIRRGDPAKALELYHNINDSIISPPTSYSMTKAAAFACRVQKEFSQTERFIESVSRDQLKRLPPLLHLLTSVLVQYARQADIEKAQALYDKAIAACKPDIKLLSTMLLVYANARMPVEAESLFSSVQEQYGITPDLTMLNIIMKLYSETLDIDAARSHLDQYRTYNVEPDTYTATTLIDLYASRFDPEGAQVVYDELIQVLPVSVEMITSLMAAYEKSGDLDNVNRLIIETQERGFKPTTIILNILLSAFSKSGQETSQLSVYIQRFKQFGAEPNDHTHSIILQHHIRNNDLDAAEQYYSTITPNEHHQTIMTIACHRLDPSKSQLYAPRHPSAKARIILNNSRMQPGNEGSIESTISLLRKSRDSPALVSAYFHQILEKLSLNYSKHGRINRGASGLLSVPMSIYLSSVTYSPIAHEAPHSWRKAENQGFVMDELCRNQYIRLCIILNQTDEARVVARKTGLHRLTREMLDGL